MEAITSNDCYFVLYLGKMSTFSFSALFAVLWGGLSGGVVFVFQILLFLCLWGGFLWFLFVLLFGWFLVLFFLHTAVFLAPPGEAWGVNCENVHWFSDLHHFEGL